jgi:hypothetical protein
MNRRQLLKAGAGIAAVAAVGATARYAVLAPTQRHTGASTDELAVEIQDGLSEPARTRACFAWDHPLRQVHNRGLWCGGVSVNAATLSWNARRALTDLLHAHLSEAGAERLLSQFPSRYAGVNYQYLLLFGDPRSGPWQMLLSGIHLNLRIAGRLRDGAAFGGPQVYGDQRGNGRAGLPGNVFRYQMQAAHELIGTLTPAQRAATRITLAPPQTCIAVQGKAGRFDGPPVGDLPLKSRQLAQAVVAGILENYGEVDAAYAKDCLDRNGGVDALHFADYDVDFQGGRHAGDSPSQVFRLEGPAAVFHFRGEPHLHAFVNVERDADQPLSLGDVLGSNPAPLEGTALQAWYEAAMQRHTHADMGYYPPYSVVGRLRPGTIRTGDIWAAESWVDDLVVCDIKGADLAPGFAKLMSSRGKAPQAQSIYRVATLRHFAANASPAQMGRVSATDNKGLLRDALVTQARSDGFSRAQA